jgi:peptidoglycan/LPS O-acetylase OafA/YrhL
VNPSPAYRPDIDGLRAVAVAMVILFHAAPAFCPGGFVGVDVFFVISGYLITSVIWREMRTGTFTLTQFYARRCRRILPALFVVLGATWIAARLRLTADDVHGLARHIIGGATFTSNILLWQETGYFDIAAFRKPLLHLWSLGVEEQFYAVWPPVVMLIVARHWRLGRITTLVLALSLALTIILLPAHPDLVFYMLPTRMWELLTGALLASRDHARTPVRAPGAGSDWQALLGAALIVPVCFIDPGAGRWHLVWLIAPVLGTALLIATPQAWINERLLSRPAVVTIGLISYPLYLWHWPLLSMTTLLNQQATPLQIARLQAAAVAAAFALAWCTWRFVELPVRRFSSAPALSMPIRNRQLLAISAALLLATAAAGWFAMRTSTPVLASTAAPVATPGAAEPLLDGDSIYEGAAWHRYSGADRVILLVGDSHAHQYLDGLLPLVRSRGFGISHIGLGGCLGLPLAERLWGTAELFARCQALADATFPRFVDDPAVKVVLFAARGELYAEGTEAGMTVAPEHHTRLRLERRASVLHDSYDAAIGRAAAAGKRVVLALDIPELDYVPEYCGDHEPATGSKPHCVIARSRVDARQRTYRRVVARLQREHPGLAVFDPLPLLCDEQWCYAKRDGVLMYNGDNHLSVDGSRIVSERLAEVVLPR